MAIEIEKQQKLSDSMLWQLQEVAYNQFAIEAWTQKGVPSYLTSHPLSAKYYANMAASYVSSLDIDPSEPIYLFDLGAGTGRFAYLFLQEFLPLLPENFPIKYVMTDIVQQNLDALKMHSHLQDYIEKELVEFVLYKHSDGPEFFRLLKNPAVLICNYFFDTIPQDLFRVKDSELYEGRITLSVEDNIKFNDVLDPSLIPHLHASYDYQKIDNPYPDFPQYASFLKMYSQALESATILFPLGALQAIDTFRQLTADRLLVLAADQGLSSNEQAIDFCEPKIARHGSFSIQVSYHLLGHYFRFLKGSAYLTDHPDTTFVNLAATLPKSSLQSTFDLTFNTFEPSDYLRLSNAVEEDCPKPSLDHILTLLKLGNWDPINFHLFYGAIREKLPTASDQSKRFLYDALQNVHDKFYPTADEEGNLLLNIGVLFFELGTPYEALICFEEALNYLPDSQLLHDNIKACQGQLTS